jgi:hypothetical protein
MYQGCYPIIRSTIVVSLDSFEFLEISDPPVSETETSSFAELGSAEQIVTMCIDQKLEHPIFPENRIFLDSIEKLMLATANRLPLCFHP